MNLKKETIKSIAILVLLSSVVTTSAAYSKNLNKIETMETMIKSVKKRIEKEKNIKETNEKNIKKVSVNNSIRITKDILNNNGLKVVSGEGGADHALISDEKLKFKIMDEIKSSIGKPSDLNILNPLDVREISGLSEEEFKNILPEALKEISGVLYNAENSDKPINGVFLASICKLESADGTSKLAKERNNIAGINARDADKGTDAYGSRYESKSACAEELLRKIRDEYVYSTTDFRSNGVSVYDINKKYCSMCTWSYKILLKAKEMEVK